MYTYTQYIYINIYTHIHTCTYTYIKTPPKWQRNDLVSGGHGRAAKLGACVNWMDWLCTREIMLFIGKPMGRLIMISNATNPLKES